MYVDAGHIERCPACRVVAETFHSPQTTKSLEALCGISLAGNLLRIEYTNDRDGFWLAPHTDIGVKKFTMFIYLSRDLENADWGTDIYRSADEPAFQIGRASCRGRV